MGLRRHLWHFWPNLYVTIDGEPARVLWLSRHWHVYWCRTSVLNRWRVPEVSWVLRIGRLHIQWIT